MKWLIVVELIAKYGLPWVLELFQIIKDHPEITPEAITKLKVLSQKTLADYKNEVTQ